MLKLFLINQIGLYQLAHDHSIDNKPKLIYGKPKLMLSSHMPQSYRLIKIDRS